MKIVLASRNRKKIAELHAILHRYFSDIEILSLDDVGIFGEIEENGESFAEMHSSRRALPLRRE